MAMPTDPKMRLETAAYNIAKATLTESGEFTDVQAHALALAMGRAAWTLAGYIANREVEASQAVTLYQQAIQKAPHEKES
jgi:hypothetical protein